MKIVLPLLLSIIFLLTSCKEPVFNPKPRMFPKIDFPERQYISFEANSCPFTFSYPDYWHYEKDSTFFGEITTHDCWFNMEIKIFNGTLHCTYNKIVTKENLQKYMKDAFKLAREHQIKANYIDEIPIKKPNKVYGILYNIEGPAASPFQFYLTDSVRHFIRGSLYFNSKTNPDSIQPIAEYVKRDLMTMLNSFEWSK